MRWDNSKQHIPIFQPKTPPEGQHIARGIETQHGDIVVDPPSLAQPTVIFIVADGEHSSARDDKQMGGRKGTGFKHVYRYYTGRMNWRLEDILSRKTSRSLFECFALHEQFVFVH